MEYVLANTVYGLIGHAGFCRINTLDVGEIIESKREKNTKHKTNKIKE